MVGTMQIKGTTVNRTFDERQVTSAHWNGAWYSAREFANEKENIYLYFHAGYVGSCGEKPKKGEFKEKCTKFEGAWTGRLKTGAKPVVANVKFQTEAGTAHIEGSEYAVAGGTPAVCVWRSQYALAVMADGRWTPILFDHKTQTVRVGDPIGSDAPSQEDIEEACGGKSERAWCGVLMSGERRDVAVGFDGTKIEGSVVVSKDGTKYEEYEGRWLSPRVFVFGMFVGERFQWVTVYVAVGFVRTGLIQHPDGSVTKEPTEDEANIASTRDRGPWTGVLSDGSEAADVTVLNVGARIKGGTVLKDDDTILGTGEWYSRNAFAFLMDNKGSYIAVYLEDDFVVRQAPITDKAALDGLTRAEKAAEVREIVKTDESGEWTGRLYNGG
jgi:hypothetical protein